MEATTHNHRKRRVDPDDDHDEVAERDPNFGSYLTSPRDKAAKRRALLAADAEMDVDSDPPHAPSPASSSSSHDDWSILERLRTQSPALHDASSSYSQDGPPRWMPAQRRPSHTPSRHLSPHLEVLCQPGSRSPRSSASRNRFGLEPRFESSIPSTSESPSWTDLRSPQPDELECQGVLRVIHYSNFPDSLHLEAGPESLIDSYPYSDPPSATPTSQPGPSRRQAASSVGPFLQLEEEKNRNAIAILLGLVAHIQRRAETAMAPPEPTHKLFASSSSTHGNVATPARSHASRGSTAAQASSLKRPASPAVERQREREGLPDITAITPPPPPPQPEPILVDSDSDSDEVIFEIEVSCGEEPAYHKDQRGRGRAPRNQGERAILRLGKKKVEKLINLRCLGLVATDRESRHRLNKMRDVAADIGANPNNQADVDAVDKADSLLRKMARAKLTDALNKLF